MVSSYESLYSLLTVLCVHISLLDKVQTQTRDPCGSGTIFYRVCKGYTAKKFWVDLTYRLGCLSCNSAICATVILVGYCAAAMQSPSTNLLDTHAECSNIHLFTAICLQYSHDDVIGISQIFIVSLSYIIHVSTVA